MIFLTIIMVVLAFSLLVIIHEFGHFIAARRNGVKVEEFGIGFPPKIFGYQGKKTLYTINLLPLGGFVRLRGEVGSDKAKDSFASKSTWVKTKILLAGVTMNIALAYGIITLLCATGLPPVYFADAPSFGSITPVKVEQPNLAIFQIAKDSPAEKSGLKSGQIIVSIDGIKLSDNEQLREYTKSHKGKTVSLEVREGSETKTYSILLGDNEQTGVLGVAAVSQQMSRYVWWQAPIAALGIMLKLVVMTLGAFGGLIVSLFTKAKVTEGVTGPIGITVIFGEVVKFGWQYVLALIASISLSLGVINAMPIPALDGGRLMLVLLNRRNVHVSHKVENAMHLVGFVALIALMIFVAVSDISRFR